MMENNSELVRLEEFVDSLLQKYRQMKETCTAMESMLEERSAECAKLKKTVDELRNERTLVGEKVAGLIDRIEQWETEMETGEVSGESDLARLQGKLFQNRQEAAE